MNIFNFPEKENVQSDRRLEMKLKEEQVCFGIMFTASVHATKLASTLKLAIHLILNILKAFKKPFKNTRLKIHYKSNI